MFPGRGGRAVECGGLENRLRGFSSDEGSNPILSAIDRFKSHFDELSAIRISGADLRVRLIQPAASQAQFFARVSEGMAEPSTCGSRRKTKAQSQVFYGSEVQSNPTELLLTFA